MSDCLVITPTYNEKENIEKIIRKVFSLPKEFDMLIVEDNSPDGTGAIVKELMKEFPDRLFIKERAGKQGLGTAYLEGFRYGLEHGYDYMIEMDADFSHNPDDLLRLYDACATGKGDVVVGSRYVDGKISVVNWPMGRLMMSYYASMYVRMVTGMKVFDATAGFVCYSRRVLEKIKFDKVRFVGYAFQIEMKYTATRLGFKIFEVPIVFTDRIYGSSKMSMKIFKEAFFGVFSLRFRCWRRY
ncbi:MAG: polyprenol monophosphomannose synthase [Bacteroidales bacterium]|nr:polyprenol monophosphomannose synthase [Bacteroidales bacterium]